MHEIAALVKEGNPERITSYMKAHNLRLEGGKIKAPEDKVDWVKSQVGFWDQRQQAR